MVFYFAQNFFFGQHKSQNIFIFFLLRKARNYFPEFNIRLYDKNSESDYFFFLHQNQNIFFSNIGNQNIFYRKKPYPPPPPLQVKWSFPYKFITSVQHTNKSSSRLLEGYYKFITSVQHTNQGRIQDLWLGGGGGGGSGDRLRSPAGPGQYPGRGRGPRGAKPP